jgi:hypothetical protein
MCRPKGNGWLTGPSRMSRTRRWCADDADLRLRLGQTSLGQTRLGQTRLGQTTLGQTRLGETERPPGIW